MSPPRATAPPPEAGYSNEVGAVAEHLFYLTYNASPQASRTEERELPEAQLVTEPYKQLFGCLAKPECGDLQDSMYGDPYSDHLSKPSCFRPLCQ